MPLKLTHEEFLQQCKQNNSHYDDIEFLSVYNGRKEKIKCRCKIDSYEWEYIAERLLSGSGCPKCLSVYRSKEKAIPYEVFLNKFNENYPDSTIGFLGEIREKGKPTKVRCQCKICKHEWSAFIGNLMKGKGCVKCSRRKQSLKYRKSQEVISQEVLDLKANIILLGEYINRNTKTTFECKLCNHIWKEKPVNILKNPYCPNCGLKSKPVKEDCDFILKVRKSNPDIEVLSLYIDSRTKVDIKCKNCGHIGKVRPDRLYTKYSCPNCRLKSKHKNFVARMENINQNITVLGTFKNSTTPILCRCKRDGYEWYATPSSLLSGNSCPKCAYRRTGTGVNDIATLYPELVKYFKNPDDAKLFTYGSSQYVETRCPECGHEKNIQVTNLFLNGFCCPNCSDNISYPNKFSYSFLYQLPVENIKHEYSPDWIKPRRYDNYFEYQGKSYILEMDGSWHYKDNYCSGQTAKRSQEIDRYKDKMAFEHNIEVIRIDCRKSNSKYISQNILTSRLAEIFDLSNIDWELCDKNSQHTIVKQVCVYFNDTSQSIDEIGKHFNLHPDTVKRYIKIGQRHKWCDCKL